MVIKPFSEKREGPSIPRLFKITDKDLAVNLSETEMVPIIRWWSGLDSKNVEGHSILIYFVNTNIIK